MSETPEQFAIRRAVRVEREQSESDAKLGAALRAALATLNGEERLEIDNHETDGGRVWHISHHGAASRSTDETRALSALLRSPTPEGPP